MTGPKAGVPVAAPLADPLAEPATESPSSPLLLAPAPHVLVTGAARGIGAAVARRLAADGWRVSLLGRNRDALHAVEATLAPGQHLVVVADVTDEAQVQAAFTEARAVLGPLSALVNNAGAAESAPFAKTRRATWDRMLAINLTGAFICSQAALPDLRSRRATGGQGRLVNIASTAGQRGYPYVAAYVAAKHGLVGLTRALALELAAEGVTVNAVCPGFTDTDLLADSVERIVEKTGRSADAARAALAAHNPQGRLVQPAEVAAAVAWLLGDGAAAITGQCLSVSGGEVMA